MTPHQENEIVTVVMIVSSITGIPEQKILGTERTAKIVEARQLAIFFSVRKTSPSLKEIAKMFRKDPTSILASVRKVEELLEVERERPFGELYGKILQSVCEALRTEERKNSKAMAHLSISEINGDPDHSAIVEISIKNVGEIPEVLRVGLKKEDLAACLFGGRIDVDVIRNTIGGKGGK